MSVLLWAVLGYLAGSVPSAYVAAMITGHRSVLERVRRDAGETDAHMLLRVSGSGKAAGIAGTADVLKALVVTLLASVIAGPHEAAAAAVAAVTGHCWPPILRNLGGRGLSAAAGAFLVLLPVEMVLGGLVALAGTLAKFGAPVATLGFVLVPVAAGLRGQPAPFRLAAWTIVILILVRRLEGISADLAEGVGVRRALWSRLVFDATPGSRAR